MSVVFEGPGKPRPRGFFPPDLVLSLPPLERAAGWEREIAPAAIRELDIVPHFLSDDSIILGQPPRITQTTVAKQVREVKHYRDSSYGTHFGCYSGLNLLPVFGESQKNVPTVPRTHHHFYSGVESGWFEPPPLHPTAAEMEIAKQRHFRVPTPSESAAMLNKMRSLVPPKTSLPANREAVFPDPAYCIVTDPPPPPPEQPPPPAPPPEPYTLPMRFCVHDNGNLNIFLTSLKWGTPFWYNGSLERPRLPVGAEDDYAFSQLHRQSEPSKVCQDIEVEDPGCYIPGQIAGAIERPDTSPDPDGDQEPTTTKTAGPLYKGKFLKYRPPVENFQLDPWICADLEALKRDSEVQNVIDITNVFHLGLNQLSLEKDVIIQASRFPC